MPRGRRAYLARSRMRANTDTRNRLRSRKTCRRLGGRVYEWTWAGHGGIGCNVSGAAGCADALYVATELDRAGWRELAVAAGVVEACWV